MGDTQKPLVWVGRSLEELKRVPDDVVDVMGFALWQAQLGEKHPAAKPLTGFRGAGVLEIVDDFDGDTYRAVYSVRFSEAVYVLYAFQKKSKHGIATPKRDLAMIERRLTEAQAAHEEREWRQARERGHEQ